MCSGSFYLQIIYAFIASKILAIFAFSIVGLSYVLFLTSSKVNPPIFDTLPLNARSTTSFPNPYTSNICAPQ